MITIEKADPSAPDSLDLIEKLSAELAAITGDSGKRHFTPESLLGERSLWVVAKNKQGIAVGCGAIRPLANDIAELKRMFSDRSSAGIGNALLTFWKARRRVWVIKPCGLKPGGSTSGRLSFIVKMATQSLRITGLILAGTRRYVSQKRYKAERAST